MWSSKAQAVAWKTLRRTRSKAGVVSMTGSFGFRSGSALSPRGRKESWLGCPNHRSPSTSTKESGCLSKVSTSKCQKVTVKPPSRIFSLKKTKKKRSKSAGRNPQYYKKWSTWTTLGTTLDISQEMTWSIIITPTSSLNSHPINLSTKTSKSTSLTTHPAF